MAKNEQDSNIEPTGNQNPQSDRSFDDLNDTNPILNGSPKSTPESGSSKPSSNSNGSDSPNKNDKSSGGNSSGKDGGKGNQSTGSDGNGGQSRNGSGVSGNNLGGSSDGGSGFSSGGQSTPSDSSGIGLGSAGGVAGSSSNPNSTLTSGSSGGGGGSSNNSGDDVNPAKTTDDSMKKGLGVGSKLLGGGGAFGRVADKATAKSKAFVDKSTEFVQKTSSKMHIGLNEKQSKRVLTTFGVVTILFGGLGLSGVFDDEQILDAPGVCDTRNDGDISYGGGTGEAGATDDWSQQGSTTYKNAEAFVKMMKDLGFSGNAIAGVGGNIVQESRFDTKLENQTEASGNSGAVPADQAGYGLFQWTLGRRVQLNNLAKEKGKPIWDLDLQLGLIKSDLSTEANWVSAYKPISPKILNHASSPEDAAMRFYLSQFIAGGGNASPPDGSAENRQKFAKQFYSVFNLSSVKGDDSKVSGLIGGATSNDASENSALAEGLNVANCEGNSSAQVTDDLLAAAKSMLGYFTYSMPNRTNVAKKGSYQDVKTIDDLNKDGSTDCSGFVWLSMRLAGYDIPDDMFATPFIQSDAEGEHKYLKEIKPEEAGPGTIVVVNVNGGEGSNGHTGILEEKWKGGSTKVINQGGGIMNGVSEAEFQNAFGPVDSSNTITGGILSGGHVKFAVPVGKGEKK